MSGAGGGARCRAGLAGWLAGGEGGG
eukprot:COSAG02_NODE_13173_length_1432_cov_1.868717_2_plen_25_part_01